MLGEGTRRLEDNQGGIVQIEIVLMQGRRVFWTCVIEGMRNFKKGIKIACFLNFVKYYNYKSILCIYYLLCGKCILCIIELKLN